MMLAATGCGVMNKSADRTLKSSQTSVSASHKKTPATPELTDSVKNLLKGEWQILKVGAENVPALDDMPYVNFDPDKNAFYASNGCNILNGSLAVEGAEISFGGVLSTMKACPDMAFSDKINEVISDGRTFTVVHQLRDGVDYINLNTAPGQTAMKLTRCDMSFINGEWQIVKIGTKSYDNPELNVFFDIPEGKVHGNTGCNYFNGMIYHDVYVPYSLNFGDMATTRMACPDDSAQTALLVALEQVTKAKPLTSDTVQLCDNAGKVLLTLKRVQVDKN